MKTKPILCPQRLRHVPQQFSWIDQRLVRHGHITRCGPHALALYLLLATVADAQGLSYYSESTTTRLLSLSATQLREARTQLLAAGLIAYEAPFYQVLSLEPQPVSAQELAPVSGHLAPEPQRRGSEPLSMAQIFRQMMDEQSPPES
jgi:hypothetical protein